MFLFLSFYKGLYVSTLISLDGSHFSFMKELFAIVPFVSYFLEFLWKISPSEFQAIDS